MTLIFMIRYDYFTTIGTLEHNSFSRDATCRMNLIVQEGANG